MTLPTVLLYYITKPCSDAVVMSCVSPTVPEWTVDSNKNQVPLAIEVVSTNKLEPYFTRAVKQRYDFYEFYGNIRPDMDRLEVRPSTHSTK